MVRGIDINREIRDRALMAIAQKHLGWNTDNPLEMSDEVAAAVKLALEAAYEAGRRAPLAWFRRERGE